MDTRDQALVEGFGRVLRDRRTRAQLSQEALAELAGLHRNYIGQIERGLKAPSLVVIAALAKALKTKPHLLVEAAERRT